MRATDNTTSFRIVQWNVWFRERAEHVLKVLRQIDADIICLQELTQNSYINPSVDIPQLIANMGYDYSFQLALKQDGPEYYHMGNGIFSKYPIVSRRHVYLAEESSRHPQQEARIYLEVILQLPAGGLLTVGTAHLSFEVSQLETETDRLLNAIHHHAERFIFTGDLNAPPDSATVKRLEAKLRAAGPHYTQPTWPTKPYAFHGVAVPLLDKRLDYLFTTHDIHMTGSEVVQTTYSDHLPLVASLTL